MKKFLIKVLTFILIVSTVTACVNYAYIKRDKTNLNMTDKFKDIPDSIKICNFGSSHGLFGFNYQDVTGEECFNFALSSQFFSYDQRLFDNYKNHIAEGAVVFLPMSYFLLFGKGERTEGDFAEKNKRYYNILPPALIKDYDVKTDIFVHYLPSLSADADLIKVLLGKTEDANDATWIRVSTDIDVEKDAEAAYIRHVVNNRLDDNGNRIINQEEIDSLKYIITACKDIGATPVLITTPFLQEYTDEIKEKDKEFYSDFYNLVNEIVEEMDVEYYDYAFDERFVKNYEWFLNADHLNKEGARQFVNILMDEVVHYGSEQSLLEGA